MQTIIPSHGAEGVAQIALRVPVSLRNFLKTEARRQGRSMNSHLVMILKEAAGNELDGETPAAGNENAALARGEV